MTTPDMPRVDLCNCERFELWFVETPSEFIGDVGYAWRVCRCGHRTIEHIMGYGPCIGEVEAWRGLRSDE